MPLGIIDAEQLFKKNNLHYVKSGIDDSIGKKMGKKKIALVFNLKQLITQKGKERSITIERMKKNMGYAAKYKIPVLFASQATNKYELFNGIMIKSIARLLGLKEWKWSAESYKRSVES
jgi:RNase P/RNase MRP subunit p30